MAFISTTAERRWVADWLARGLLAVHVGHWLDRKRTGRGFCRYLGKLEEKGVVEQWTIVAEDRQGHDFALHLIEPAHGVPLYVAGKHWNKFIAEATKLGLKEHDA
jgi:hypothetical protein